MRNDPYHPLNRAVPDEQRYFGLEDELASYERAELVIIQAPYEATVSYGVGTSKGPAAIMKATRQVELYDEEMDAESVPQRGVYTTAPLDTDCDGEEICQRIYKVAKYAVADGKVPVLIGGEHTVSYGNVRAVAEKYGKQLSILHIDAHSDLRQEYAGKKFNHATAAARFGELAPIVQVGIRSRERSHADEVADMPHAIWCYHAFEIAGRTDWIDEAVGHLTDTIYITVDVDGFDPSVFPGTGTPEPGGLEWWQGMELFRKACTGRRVVGLDIVEVAPLPGTQQSEFAAGRMLSKLINYCTQLGRRL